MNRLYGRLASVVILLLFQIVMRGLSYGADSGLDMMKVETGARAAGIGGAYGSLSGEPFAAVYNPAGVHGLTQFAAAFEHNEFWSDIRIESGYFAAPLRDRIAIFGGLKYAALGNLEIRQLPTSVPDAYADAHDISFKTGLSYRVNENLHAGFGLGWMLEKIGTHRGSSFNVDLGVQAIVLPRVHAGVSVTNIGSDITLRHKNEVDSRPIALPTTYRLGASYHGERFVGASDLVVLDDEAHLHVGVERPIHRLFSVRAGYMFNYDSKGLSAGLSFVRRNLAIDYAFVPYSNNLDDSHQFTFTFVL